jgi:hypothetical protein
LATSGLRGQGARTTNGHLVSRGGREFLPLPAIDLGDSVSAWRRESVNVHYSDKVEEHSGQLAQFLFPTIHVVLPWCTQTSAFVESPVNNVNSSGFNVSLAVRHFVRKCVGVGVVMENSNGKVMVTYFSF